MVLLVVSIRARMWRDSPAAKVSWRDITGTEGPGAICLSVPRRTVVVGPSAAAGEDSVHQPESGQQQGQERDGKGTRHGPNLQVAVIHE